jgi:tRNA dimethylallyltransferase
VNGSAPMPASAAPLPFGIAILGPTGSGKSALAMRLARELPVEIISVDSAQVYRDMDVGTAKPTPAERREVPHHLIDIIDPEGVYSAGQFRTDALRLIGEISARGRIPLLVGGTMLYFRALFRGIADLPGADARLRERIDARAREEGWPAMHAELAARDPAGAARIHPHDAQRIQRALELSTQTGRPLGALQLQEDSYNRFGSWRICVLEPGDRRRLHEVLEQRLAAMFDAGLVEEVRRLLARETLSARSPALRLVGYRQLVGHIRDKEPLPTASARILAATRQLAKRQLTWLRGDYLLPDGATVLHSDCFDQTMLERTLRVLIEAGKAP